MPGSPTPKDARSTTSQSRSHRRQQSRRSSKSLDAKPESPRVVLGLNAIAKLPTELNKLCLSFPLIIHSPSRRSLANRIRSLLPNFSADIINSDKHPDLAMLSGRDSVISVGGPWAVAMARRISLKMNIPHICVPTMHSGAAGDRPPWGKHDADKGSLKTSDEESGGQSDDEKTSLPAVIIYDEKLTESCITRFSAPSGHVVDAQAETDAEDDESAAAAAPTAVDETDTDESTPRSTKISTAQWSFINLPGV